VQARGQATFERILDTTAGLLESVGAEVLTTNLVAKTAGVNVATLYQYFPNKQAVLLALFERQSSARLELVERYITGLGTTTDWRRQLRTMVQGIARFRTATRGVVPLRQAMRSSPDLQDHDREHWRGIATKLAEELGQVGLRGEKAVLVARTAAEMMSSLLDLWTIETGGKDAKVLEQIEDALAGYLGPYLERRRGKRA
jgi:AcrR family transcriptional regulator